MKSNPVGAPKALGSRTRTPEETLLLRKFFIPLLKGFKGITSEYEALELILAHNTRQVWWLEVISEFKMPGVYLHKGVRALGPRRVDIPIGAQLYVAADKVENRLKAEVVLSPDNLNEETTQYYLTPRMFRMIEKNLRLIG